MARKAKAKAKRTANRAAKRTVAKAKPPVADPIDTYIAASAQALDLPLTAQYRPGVKMNFVVTLRMASIVTAFPLPDEAEPAPVFGA